MGNLSTPRRLCLATAVSLSGLAFIAAGTFVDASKAAAYPTPNTQHPSSTLTKEQMVVNLLNRAEFGPRPGDVERVEQMGLTTWIDQQLHPETIDDSAVEAKLSSLTVLQESNAAMAQAYDQERKTARERKLLLAQLERQQAAATPAMSSGQSGAAAAPGAKNKLEAFTAVMTPEQQAEARQLQQKQRQQGAAAGPTELVVAKVMRAVESQRQLQEVLVDFWSNHFNIDVRKNACRVYKVSDDRDVIRPHVLGKFRDLLEASAKSPAMLVYLDNAQSSGPQAPRPNRPQQRRGRFGLATQGTAALPAAARTAPRKGGGLNENYGREIMELHTLGVDGGYTQKDVTEVARCLTGWTIGRQAGSFRFDPRRHDNGQKVVLGHVIPAGGGIQDGETVLDILASHPATMRHVSYQLCQRFVSDEPPASLVNSCVATWKRTDGDIGQIVRTILTSPEFNSRLAYQQKIKSPFEYAVSAARALGATCVVADGHLRANAEGVQRKATKGYSGGTAIRYLPGQIATMGEPLFQCQPPTGYPEDSRKWVSSGALISRLNFALELTGGKLADVSLAAAEGALYGDPPGAASPAQFVSHLTGMILHGEVSPSTRATLLHEASLMSQTDRAQPQNVSYTSGSAPATTDPQTERKLAALVLGSPEFQRR